MLEKMQSLADNNSYLEISDQQTQAGLQMIKKFSPSQIEASIKHISEIPFLEAYSKNDGIYLLRPTQEFCSYMKSST